MGWIKRRRRTGDIFDDIDRIFEDMMKSISEEASKNLIKDKKLPDGSVVRTMGPFVYGYSMTLGPDGKPIVSEFGNVKQESGTLDAPKPSERREPLVEVLSGEKVVQVVAEVPGVERQDIALHATEDRLRISVDAERQKYYKEVDLPAKVDPKSAKASYKNGVLEVLFNKMEVDRKPTGERIKVD